MLTKKLCTHNNCAGFTLLEVLIAITLTGLVMGSLFALQSQSKQLTFRSLSALDRLTEQRAVINAAWIGLKQHNQKQHNYFIENVSVVDIPNSLEDKQNKIKNLKFQLESLDITDSSHQILFSTVRLVKKQK
ncbi:MAG: prepilin-type N-terminal cleavage/methylation domain-containing protein [Pseudomonadota bacterium]